MTYVISDLHGCLDKWQAMLEQIKLKETDMLFVLGDVVDRGPSPIPLLLDLMMRPNVFPILGNHECSMLLCVQDLPLDTTLQNLPQRVSKGSLPSLRMWMKNGGRTTFWPSPVTRRNSCSIIFRNSPSMRASPSRTPPPIGI